MPDFEETNDLVRVSALVQRANAPECPGSRASCGTRLTPGCGTEDKERLWVHKSTGQLKSKPKREQLKTHSATKASGLCTKRSDDPTTAPCHKAYPALWTSPRCPSPGNVTAQGLQCCSCTGVTKLIQSASTLADDLLGLLFLKPIKCGFPGRPGGFSSPVSSISRTRSRSAPSMGRTLLTLPLKEQTQPIRSFTIRSIIKIQNDLNATVHVCSSLFIRLTRPMSTIYFSYCQAIQELPPGALQGLRPPAESLLLPNWDRFLPFSRHLPKQETLQLVQSHFS